MAAYPRPLIIPAWAETGDKVQPTDAEMAEGWPSSSVPPSRQRFNFAFNYTFSGVRYLLQRGIADWAIGDEYAIGAIVRAPNGKTYRAKTAGTGQEPSANPGVWERWGFTLTELYAEQDKLAPIDNPVFTTNARGITRPVNDNTVAFATTEFVTRAINNALVSLIPVGIIVIWRGTTADIPPKWQVCDGTNGTPDLRDKFVLGAGPTYGVNAIGGASVVTLNVDHMPPHTHAINVQAVGDHAHGAWTDVQGWHAHDMGGAGGHAHSIYVTQTDAAGDADGGNAAPLTSNKEPRGGANPYGYMGTNGVGDHAHAIYGSGTHSHNVGMNGAGGHTHHASSQSAGGGQAHNNMPPYFAKLFIMRVEA